MSTIFGFLRETQVIAEKSGKDEETGLVRTGLDKYLSVIFPETHDWIHDKQITVTDNKLKSRRRPDYRSESLKLIVEFDGIPHYTNPEIIVKDEESTNYYTKLGYKVVRIPFFIQLTNDAVEKLFGVKVSEELFDNRLSSISPKCKNTPAFLCISGIKRMAKEFTNFPEQYKTNAKFLKSLNDDYLTGISLLEYFFNLYNKSPK